MATKTKNKPIDPTKQGTIPLRFIMYFTAYTFHKYIESLTVNELIHLFENEKDEEVREEIFKWIKEHKQFTTQKAVELYKKKTLPDSFRQSLRSFLAEKGKLDVSLLLFDSRSCGIDSDKYLAFAYDIEILLKQEKLSNIITLYKEALHENERFILLPIIFQHKEVTKSVALKFYQQLKEDARTRFFPKLFRKFKSEIEFIFEIYNWEKSVLIRDKIFNSLKGNEGAIRKVITGNIFEN